MGGGGGSYGGSDPDNSDNMSGHEQGTGSKVCVERQRVAGSAQAMEATYSSQREQLLSCPVAFCRGLVSGAPMIDENPHVFCFPKKPRNCSACGRLPSRMLHVQQRLRRRNLLCSERKEDALLGRHLLKSLQCWGPAYFLVNQCLFTEAGCVPSANWIRSCCLLPVLESCLVVFP